jgi:peptidyl-prolyl cis-trans isomerase D
VTKITPARPATFEEAKVKIEADLRQRAARSKSATLSGQFDDARQTGASVAAAAQKVGVAALTLGPVTAQGTGADRKPNPLLDAKILKAAFAAAQGEETDLQDEGNGEYFALKVEKVMPPSLPDLEQNRAGLTQEYIREQYLKALATKAQALIAQVKAGATMDMAAASVGGSVIHQNGIQRIQLQQYQNLGREFLEGVFGSKPGNVFGALTPTGVAIAKLDAIRPGDRTATATLAEEIRQRMSQDYMRELIDNVREAAEKNVKVTTNLDLARKTIGVDAATMAKLKTPPALIKAK